MKTKKISHEFTWTSKNTGTCGDNYCDGHQDFEVKCVCGWKKKFVDSRPHNQEEQNLMLNHRLDCLERKFK